MVSSFSSISHYFVVWCPTYFIALRLNALWLKFKAQLIWLQQRLGQQEKACAWGLEKTLRYVHMVVRRQSHPASLTQAKRDLKKRLGQRMTNGKAICKPGIGETAKDSRGTVPGPHKGYL